MVTEFPLYRIYFDANEGTEDGAYGLWLVQSLKDLSEIPGGPQVGMRVILCMPDDGEMQGVLQFSEKWSGWTAVAIPGTWKDYSKGDR